ncbi:hypothetical protein RUM43_008670 [Polyplax serrata]|uniref:Uncharacterized protein n=1 Tax=Polyplax serrata TaxID=468196 RepID=A0AAN8NUP6_POLSC
MPPTWGPLLDQTDFLRPSPPPNNNIGSSQEHVRNRNKSPRGRFPWQVSYQTTRHWQLQGRLLLEKINEPAHEKSSIEDRKKTKMAERKSDDESETYKTNDIAIYHDMLTHSIKTSVSVVPRLLYKVSNGGPGRVASTLSALITSAHLCAPDSIQANWRMSSMWNDETRVEFPPRT